jgi:pilus assembly protein CpaE
MDIRLMVADPDPVFAKEITAEFGLVKEVDIIGTESSWERVETAISSSRPGIVLFGPGWAKNRVLSGFQEIKQKYPEIEAVLVTAEYTTELRRQAVEAGFNGVYGIPIDSKDLLLCFRRIAAGGGRRKGKKPRSGKIITVFSTKGGVGKTVIATNLAVALGQQPKKRAVVVDLDLQFGDVGVMLKLMPKHTLYDLVGLKSVDLGQLQGLLTPFSDQVSAFVGPLQPELADLVTPDIVQPVFGWLRQAFDYVIIDTPPCFNDNVLSVLDETDELHLVATLDLPSLKNIKLCLQTLKLLDFPRDKMKLVLNRVQRNVGLTATEVEEIFEEEISVQIPNDNAVPLAVNKGAPVVLEAPKSPAGKALFKLSDISVERVGRANRNEVAQSVPA